MDGKNLRKAAILWWSLERKEAELMLEGLTEQQQRELAEAVVELGEVGKEERKIIWEEIGGDEEPSGVELALSCQRDLKCESVGKPLEFLQTVSSERLLELFADEHPQTIALVAAYLPKKVAVEVLEGLKGAVQAEVVQRLMDWETPDEEVLDEVSRALQEKMLQPEQAQKPTKTTWNKVAEILEEANPKAEQHILRNLARHDRQLAGQLSQQLSPCESLESLHDTALMTVLEAADPDLGILALAGSSGALVERILAQLPPGEAKLMRHALQHLGPTTAAEVEAAQLSLLNLARQLDMEGRLQLPRRPSTDSLAATA